MSPQSAPSLAEPAQIVQQIEAGAMIPESWEYAYRDPYPKRLRSLMQPRHYDCVLRLLNSSTDRDILMGIVLAQPFASDAKFKERLFQLWHDSTCLRIKCGAVYNLLETEEMTSELADVLNFLNSHLSDFRNLVLTSIGSEAKLLGSFLDNVLNPLSTLPESKFWMHVFCLGLVAGCKRDAIELLRSLPKQDDFTELVRASALDRLSHA